VLRDTGALAEALRDVDAVAAEYADRRRAFAAEFCALDDGRAAARVVDRVFGG
jgi:CDP-glycerol glycerophosphotransferase